MAEKAASSTGSFPQGADVHYVLDERRRAALAEVDNAAFSYVHPACVDPMLIFCSSWFHVKVCMVAGLSNIFPVPVQF
jgi:PHS family inorganic phosphate transporter-like MFS transporter